MPRTLLMRTKKRLLKLFEAGLKALACVALTAIVISRASGQEQSGPYQSLVIRGVAVIDGSGAPAYGPADIFVRGNRITRIAPTDAIAREEEKAEESGSKRAAPDRIIDGKG